MKVGICVPTLNAGSNWKKWLARATVAVPPGSRRLVVDSTSTDDTALLAREAGFEVIAIQRDEFDHGGTRQLAASVLQDCDVLVFLTQDAILLDSSAIIALCAVFSDPSVGAAYGRQLPHYGAKPNGAHARLFNYGDVSYMRRQEDIPRYGIKSAFMSNSFAAYRRSALEQVGGFPSKLILGEDMVVAARMLLAAWSIAYVAEAQVRHSHDYTMMQEFRRYFDIGVFHSRESWLLESFGRPEGEGRRFIKSELHYLLGRAPWLIPTTILRTLLKYSGYRLGRLEGHLPLWLKRRCSMHNGFWGKH